MSLSFVKNSKFATWSSSCSCSYVSWDNIDSQGCFKSWITMYKNTLLVFIWVLRLLITDWSALTSDPCESFLSELLYLGALSRGAAPSRNCEEQARSNLDSMIDLLRLSEGASGLPSMRSGLLMDIWDFIFRFSWTEKWWLSIPDFFFCLYKSNISSSSFII